MVVIPCSTDMSSFVSCGISCLSETLPLCDACHLNDHARSRLKKFPLSLSSSSRLCCDTINPPDSDLVMCHPSSGSGIWQGLGFEDDGYDVHWFSFGHSDKDVSNAPLFLSGQPVTYYKDDDSDISDAYLIKQIWNRKNTPAIDNIASVIGCTCIFFTYTLRLNDLNPELRSPTNLTAFMNICCALPPFSPLISVPSRVG